MKKNKNIIPHNNAFDWKTFFASSIFFFVALVNPRDFPITNVPLIYPAFFFFTIVIGPHKIAQGFRRTKFLCVLLFTYWSYYTILILVKGQMIGLGHIAYLLEPIMIIMAAGAATCRPGGTKAALWALVSMITLSTACGLWIYFIGEPVASWRSTLHSSTGGNLLQGEFIRDIDLKVDWAMVELRNTGLSYYIFLFSYQLAVALLISFLALLTMRHKLSMRKLSLLIGAFLILFIGMITNTERATVLSVSIGLVSFFIIKRVKIFNLRTVSIFIICIFLVIASFNYTSKWEERYTLHKRSFVEEKIFVRAYMTIPAIGTLFFEPLGAGGMSDYYKDVAYRVGWLANYGPKASHNHFANVIMYTGVVGVSLTILLFRGIWRKVKYIRLLSYSDENVFLAASCITCIVHSFSHNAGFFRYEPSTEIVLGLFWGATAINRIQKTKRKV